MPCNQPCTGDSATELELECTTQSSNPISQATLTLFLAHILPSTRRSFPCRLALQSTDSLDQVWVFTPKRRTVGDYLVHPLSPTNTADTFQYLDTAVTAGAGGRAINHQHQVLCQTSNNANIGHHLPSKGKEFKTYHFVRPCG